MKREKHVTDYTDEQKAEAVAELAAGGSAPEIAKRMGITTSGLYYWRKMRTKKTKTTDIVAVAVPQQSVEVQHSIREATVLLRKAKSELMKGIRAGSINDLDSAHLLSMLALQSLQGD